MAKTRPPRRRYSWRLGKIIKVLTKWTKEKDLEKQNRGISEQRSKQQIKEEKVS